MSLLSYQNGRKIDYSGPRKLADLEPWVTKAVAASSYVLFRSFITTFFLNDELQYRGLKGLEASELDEVIQAEPVFFLYLHTLTAPPTTFVCDSSAAVQYLCALRFHFDRKQSLRRRKAY